MKKLITLAALATVIATPALAASKTTAGAASSYHYVASPAVTFDGKQVGQDPDANVRLMLLRDAEAGIS
jgi:heat shock protein HslJ